MSKDFIYCPHCGSRLENRLEEGSQRAYCNQCQWTHYPRPAVAVAGILRNNSGQILLVQRGREPRKELWQIPAGFLEYGEHPEETLSREIKEESGITVDKSELMQISLVTEDPRAPVTLLIFYQVQFSGQQELINDAEENTEVAWFDLGQLPEIAWQAHKDILARLS